MSHHNESCREELLFLLSPYLSLSLAHFLSLFFHCSLSLSRLPLFRFLMRRVKVEAENVYLTEKYIIQITLFTKQKPTQLTPLLKAPMTHLYSSGTLCSAHLWW